MCGMVSLLQPLCLSGWANGNVGELLLLCDSCQDDTALCGVILQFSFAKLLEHAFVPPVGDATGPSETGNFGDVESIWSD